MKFSLQAAAVVLTAMATAAQAVPPSLLITEVDPAGSTTGSPPTGTGYNADWFELTNVGITPITITGWKMDDNSNLFANAVALRGVTTIAPSQSVVFVEGLADGSTDATIDANFITQWFGGSAPAGFVIGNYGGTSVGLSQTADAVNIYDAGGTLMANVTFTTSVLGRTFDNWAGINNGAISTLSTVGVNGAFTSSSAVEIGSPGRVPEPASLSLLGFAGATLLLRRRRNKS